MRGLKGAIIQIILLIGGLALFWFFAPFQIMKNIHGYAAGITAGRTHLAVAGETRRDAYMNKQKLDARSDDVSRVSGTFFSPASPLDFIETLEKLGTATRAKVTIDPVQVIARPLPDIRVTILGDIRQALDFLRLVENASKLMEIESLNLNTSSGPLLDSGSGVLGAKIPARTNQAVNLIVVVRAITKN
ncbi:MAG: hypothetical protein HY220_02500 [Candidatus Sungbacteria bacterium]|uniref:Uncharacterized protein n=1 Tax=Candidatus Sungiibacteriota bacterium TaxID=2750080 RepID=A0A9D6QTX2_9BACT|nr:hypothetical protein [Candidatus Sungbacteria bacterium]